MSQASWHQRILYGLTNWGLFAAGLINLVVGTWSAAHQATAIAATSLTAGLVLLFAATIDRFESLRGLGVEAKTRQLDRKLEQADEALRRVKEVAELAGAALIDLNSKIGRIGGAPTPSEAYALAQRVRSIMDGLGSDQARIRATLEPWARTMCGDLAFAITRPLWRALTDAIQRLESERAALKQPLDPGDAELARLTTAINTVHRYRDERLSRIYAIELAEYPDRFLRLFDDVPLVDKTLVNTVRNKAMEFVPGMRSIQDTFTLPDPDSWFREIEQIRK